MPSQGFGKEKRLTTPHIQKIFREAPSVKKEWLILLGQPNQRAESRFACTVRRSASRLAVERNRMKRWLREAFRLHQEEIPRGIDWMVVVTKFPEKNCFRLTEEIFLDLVRESSFKRSGPTK